jgi:hypothetical protein
MIGITEPPAAIVARLFCGPDASLGTAWVDLVQVGLSGRGPVLGGPLWDILVLDLRSLDLYQDVH